ncbi:hypothetical protein Aduo_003907 [Ancylostoma duodenale]
MESTAKEGEKQQQLGTPTKSPVEEEVEIRKMKAKGKLFGKSAANLRRDGTAKEGTEKSGANVTSDVATALAPRSDGVETARSGGTTRSDGTGTTASATSVDPSTGPSTGQSTGQTSGVSSGTTRSGTEDAATGITTRTSGSSKTKGGQSATLTTSGSSATSDSTVMIRQNLNSASSLATNIALSSC